MKRKCGTLALWCLILAAAVFSINYFLYHYMLPGGAITLTWQPTPGKPFVTNMVAMLGVLLLFASIMSLLVGTIFFDKES